MWARNLVKRSEVQKLTSFAFQIFTVLLSSKFTLRICKLCRQNDSIFVIIVMCVGITCTLQMKKFVNVKSCSILEIRSDRH